ncbi:hypothetical protein LCGC14_0708080 [marine sediment metagenome]|uniref:Uncharacterized protein n=1 Tax=marine sediment metagenome TaxID=412755 RepID=A0A0F9TNH0_9ZZZZ
MRNTEKIAQANTPEQLQAEKNLSKILKQEIVLFNCNELTFMFECLTSLKYTTIDADDEQEYNDQIDRILNKISRLNK